MAWLVLNIGRASFGMMVVINANDDMHCLYNEPAKVLDTDDNP